jgi:ethanolamine permease
VASFHGIILAAGRSSFEFGRVGCAPAVLGKIHPKFQTPANALLLNMVIGIIALFTEETSGIIIISVFGALTLYITSMIAFLRLRKKEPNLERPFKVPFYPAAPITALIIAAVAFIAMTIYNFKLALIYIAIMAACFALYKINKKTGA